jgi:LmbE family N-acetylglucosaminyl deacetylase
VGIVAQQLSLAYALSVATVFTEHEKGPLSLPARIFNTFENGSASQCMAARRAEDWDALPLLWAIPVHLGLVDATFRRDESGASRCKRPEDILSADPRAEMELIHTVARRLEILIATLRPAILLVPFGLGRHVDHKIVRIASDLATAKCDLRRAVAYYEDLPYAYAPDQVNTPDLFKGWEATIVTPSVEQWACKIDAIRRYSTQLWLLAVGEKPWYVSLEDYGRTVGEGRLAERLWLKADREALHRALG